jgi:hypothetical protein
MRNPAIEKLDMLIGEWSLTLTDCWFLASRDVQQRGRAVCWWLNEAFIELEAEMEGAPMWHFVFGRSDATGQLVALYHDPRPTSRLFRVVAADHEWTLCARTRTSTSASLPRSARTGSTGDGMHQRTVASPGERIST